MHTLWNARVFLLAWLMILGAMLIQCNGCLGLQEKDPPPDNIGEDIIKSIKNDELKKLVEKLNKGEKIDLNQPTANGELPLVWAFEELESRQIVQFLIKHGAQVNIQDAFGNTPLMKAAATLYNSQIINLLIEAGADKDAQNKEGRTALMLAAKHNSHLVAALIQAGVAVNKSDQEGKTALHWAVIAPERNAILECLLKSPSINLLARDKQDNLVFHSLAEEDKYTAGDRFKKSVDMLVSKMQERGISLGASTWSNKHNQAPWDILQDSNMQSWLQTKLANL